MVQDGISIRRAEIELCGRPTMGARKETKKYISLLSQDRWLKASKAINADCDGVGNARDGGQHSQLSSGGSTLVTYATGSISSTLSRVTIYPILAADPSVSSVVSQEIPTDSVTTLKCGGRSKS